MGGISVWELATLVGGTLVGDGSRTIQSCSTLMDAQPDQVSLLHNAKYARELESTRAGCIIVAPGVVRKVNRAAGLPPLTALESENPYFAWQKAMVAFHGHRRHPAAEAAGGVSPQAFIHSSARVATGANIHPFAVVGENAVIGENVTLYPHATVLSGAKIGRDSVLFPGVTIYEECIIGERCLINAGTVIGSDGFSYAQAGGIHHKIPQTGNVIIEDDVEIGCNSIVERAALKSTIVGRGTKIGNGVVVGHNCVIGQGNLLVSQVGIAGSTSTGKYVVMAGQVGVNGHLEIPDFVRIGAQAGVMSNPEPDTEIVGSPAMEAGHAKRVYLQFMHLPELAKRVKELERQVEKLDAATRGHGDAAKGTESANR